MSAESSTLRLVSQHRCFDGVQAVYTHDSRETRCPMRFGLYLPPQARDRAVPALFWLSGLTCTEENFIAKAGRSASPPSWGWRSSSRIPVRGD